jgi:RNA polymerase sigma-70 factor (ECF subfamily)
MEDAGTLPTDRDNPSLERDEELALAARSDPVAFGVLYQRHRLAVFRYLRARTPTEEDAGELTAVTFERALAAMPRYRSTGGGVVAWLLRIARNAAIDAGRRSPTVAFDAGFADVARASSPEESALDRERLANVAAALSRLPAVQREALALRFAAGLSAREIGEVLGKTEQATQKLISRALAALREDYRHDQ